MSTGETPRDPHADAQPPATPPAAAAPPAAATALDDPWPFDEDGTFRVRAPAAEVPWPFTDDRPAPAPGGAPSEDELTLDAFERAISQTLRDKLGAAPPPEVAPKGRPGQPQGADELVASMLGALTGKDAKSALAEVRQQLAAGPQAADPRGTNVIDLAAVREARRPTRPTPPAVADSAVRIGNVLRDTFNAFMAQQAKTTGGAELTVDADFIKNNGSALLSNLFQGLAEALLPQLAPKPAPTPLRPVALTAFDLADLEREEAEGGADAAPQHDTRTSDADPTASGPQVTDRAPDAAADAALQHEATPTMKPASAPPAPSRPDAAVGNVSVKVDLGSILANLFTRRPKP